MKTFGFGQPPGIVQMAYVVPDIREAMTWWVRECRVGPWFLIERFWGPDHRYRGALSSIAAATASIISASPSKTRRRSAPRGRNEPGMIELIPARPGFDDMLTRYWRASIEWKGDNPVRPFG